MPEESVIKEAPKSNQMITCCGSPPLKKARCEDDNSSGLTAIKSDENKPGDACCNQEKKKEPTDQTDKICCRLQCFTVMGMACCEVVCLRTSEGKLRAEVRCPKRSFGSGGCLNCKVSTYVNNKYYVYLDLNNKTFLSFLLFSDCAGCKENECCVTV